MLGFELFMDSNGYLVAPCVGWRDLELGYWNDLLVILFFVLLGS